VDGRVLHVMADDRRYQVASWASSYPHNREWNNPSSGDHDSTACPRRTSTVHRPYRSPGTQRVDGSCSRLAGPPPGNRSPRSWFIKRRMARATVVTAFLLANRRKAGTTGGRDQ
jgi:hypothetical protein